MLKETTRCMFSCQVALASYFPFIIPSTTRKQLASFIKRIASRVPDLFAIDVDMPLGVLCKEDQKLEQVLGREFHISLGRTVPIRVHQIDSIVDMLLQKFQSQRQYWIEFSKWEVFVNDDQTRSFLSLEVKGAGLSEINRQIQIVNDVYRLHGLPGFYKDPRPHISLVWALGDISCALKQAIEEQSRCRNNLGSCQRHIFMCKFSGVECKIGKKSYSVCKFLS
uniref:U6 snRNA phosphodiesterase 1 n=1 Tax=Anthurium amnicola TaxID=1678845 RepID=A0A1D1Z6C2_9ARAE